MIPEVEETPKNYNTVGKISTHKYNSRSRTKRANHVKTFRNTPKMFKMEATKIIKTHIGTDYFASIKPPKKTITVNQ